MRRRKPSEVLRELCSATEGSASGGGGGGCLPDARGPDAAVAIGDVLYGSFQSTDSVRIEDQGTFLLVGGRRKGDQLIDGIKGHCYLVNHPNTGSQPSNHPEQRDGQPLGLTIYIDCKQGGCR